jgi:uncharacterized protein
VYPVERSLLDPPAAQAAFVAAMCTPAPYSAAHAAAEPIRCIETHVSWVFLTGPYAYKVKKPVRLGFLDYGTAQRRAELCAEELRLNRRHAPGLYVDVVGLHGTPAQPHVGPAGDDAFEHAVRMVQFDPSLELAHLVAADAVGRDEILKLGHDVAAMHASAGRVPEGTRYGAPEAVHRVTVDNFAEIAAVLRDADALATLARLRGSVEVLHALLHSTLARRREAGFVRECHGDLHCGNVVRWGGRLVAFDGLEFDPALRYVDVANDIAFLVMDLGARGRDDLRYAALDAWTAAAGDYAALPLLRYYEAYRALVRAKVTALRQARATGAGYAETWTYLDWALARVDAQPPLLLVAMSGLSGSGKTWLARRLGATLPALHLRSDVERKRLSGLGALEASHSTPGGGIYTQEFNARTYDHLRACAGAALAGGFGIVVDAANLRRHERQSFRELAARHGARFALVHCTAAPATLRNRVASRQSGGDDASEATLELLERQPAYWEPIGPEETAGLFALDTGDAHAVERLLATLGGSAAGPAAAK